MQKKEDESDGDGALEEIKQDILAVLPDCCWEKLHASGSWNFAGSPQSWRERERVLENFQPIRLLVRSLELVVSVSRIQQIFRVMIRLSKKRFPQTACCKVYSRRKMWRRGEAIRLAPRHIDLLLMSLYFPPRSNSAAKDAARCQSTVQAGVGPE